MHTNTPRRLRSCGGMHNATLRRFFIDEGLALCHFRRSMSTDHLDAAQTSPRPGTTHTFSNELTMSEPSRYAAAFLLFGVVGAGADWLSDRFERSDTQETALSKGQAALKLCIYSRFVLAFSGMLFNHDATISCPCEVFLWTSFVSVFCARIEEQRWQQTAVATRGTGGVYMFGR